MKERSTARNQDEPRVTSEDRPYPTIGSPPLRAPMPSPLPDSDFLDGTSTSHCELDYMEAPIESINNHMLLHVGSLIQVISTGLFHVDDRFRNFQEGFASYCIFITFEGQGQCFFRGIPRCLKRGDIIFSSNYEATQAYSTDGEWVFGFLNLFGEPCRLYEEMWNRGGFEVISVDNVEHYNEYRRLVNEAVSRPGRASFLEINRLVTNMLTELLVFREQQADTAENKSAPEWVIDALQYMNAHYREATKISEMAERYFLSADYFTRTFKKFIGKTPKEYLTFCRIDEAAMLLRGTNLTVAEIASNTGFASQSLFTRMFRQVYGCTPLGYRNKGLKM